MVSRVFPFKFLQIPIASLTCRDLHCIFKIYQIISSTSKMRQFHEFLRPIFWRVFSNWPSCAPAREDFFCCSTIKGKTILALHLSHFCLRTWNKIQNNIFYRRKMKKFGSLFIFILLACFFETIEARCRENCGGIVALVGPFGSE